MRRPGPRPAGAAHEQLKAVAAGMALVKAYRHFGHMAATLDPLGAEPPGDPALDPAPLGLTPENMASRAGRAAAHLRAGRDPGRGAPPPPGDVQRHDRVRGRAHRQPRGARLAAARDRVRRASAADGGRGPGGAARAADQRRDARAIPPQGLPGPEALQHRGPRRHGADARRDHRRRRRPGRAEGHDRHGAPRPAQRAGPRRRRQLRGDPGRVRGRTRRRRRGRRRRRAAWTT